MPQDRFPAIGLGLDLSCRSMFIKARALIGAAYARRIAWFSRIMGANDPVSQSRSNSVKPEQASIKAVQTKSNRIKPAVAENGGPAGGQKEPRECRPVKPSQTKSNRIEPNQTESNQIKPAVGENEPAGAAKKRQRNAGRSNPVKPVKPSQTRKRFEPGLRIRHANH